MRRIILAMALAAAMMQMKPLSANVEAPDPRLLRPVPQLEPLEWGMPGVAAKLAGIAGVPVAVEGLDPLCCPKRFSLTLQPGATVAAALDAAVKRDDRYEWKFVRGWIHVMPRSREAGYLLDQKFIGQIPQEGVPELRVLQLLRADTDRRWTAVSVRFGGAAPPERSFPDPMPTDLTVREALDLLLWQAGADGWATVPEKDQQGKLIGTTILIPV